MVASLPKVRLLVDDRMGYAAGLGCDAGVGRLIDA